MNEVLVSKIFNYTSTPTKNVEGQFWFNPSTNVLSRFNGTIWKPITVSSDDVAVLTDGSKVSLTNYLNTQIAALAEGIDSKQDKLKYYSETSGSTPSATISVANIKLNGSVAEGNSTTASGNGSHAEGYYTTASNLSSHAEGYHTTASGSYSHAEGYYTTASGLYSHAEGNGTKTSSDYQHTQGKWNIEDANDKYADIIGNGSSTSARSNAATVSWEGISWSQTDVRAGGTDQDSATHSLANKQDKLLYYSETSGNITISAGDTSVQNEQGGTINISAGKNTQNYLASGSSITLNGGNQSSAGGTAIFRGGDGTQSGGGKVIANGGDGGNGGNITIQAGSGIGSKGNITLGDANFLYLNSSAIGGSLIDSTISSSSLNIHIPTSKAVYDAIQTASTGLEYIKEKQGESQLNTTITAAGNPAVAGVGGDVNISSGTGSSKSGNIIIQTTNTNNSTGDISIYTGDAITKPGSISIRTGKNSKISSTGGEIIIENGYYDSNSSSGGGSGEMRLIESQNKGDIYIKPGSVSEGTNNGILNITGSVCEGRDNTVHRDSSLYPSHAEGYSTTATGSASHAEGDSTIASARVSHAEGLQTTASRVSSHAEGSLTTASGTASHAEGNSTTASGTASHAEGYFTKASSDYQHAQGKYNIEDTENKYADIIGNGSSSITSTTRSNAATVSWEGISWSQTDVRAGGTDQDSATHSLSAKQNSTDTALNTTNKTIVGAINEINSIFNVNALPTPITDVKTITTTLENLITDTQYTNKPGTILINPAITNTGAILVGENITDLNKAFPIYTDQPVTIAFKNINDFKVAGNAAGDKFNYIISFGYINQNITSDSLAIATTNGVYTITPTGNTGSEKLTISKIS